MRPQLLSYHAYKNYLKQSGLTTGQIKDICSHAAKACQTLDTPSRRAHFEAVGFVFDDSKIKTVRCNHSAVFACEEYTSWSHKWFSSGWIGLKGFRLNGRSGYEECGFIYGSTGVMNEMQGKSGDPFDFIYFQKA